MFKLCGGNRTQTLAVNFLFTRKKENNTVCVVSLNFELKRTHQFFRTVNICDRKEGRKAGRKGRGELSIEHLQCMG